jgi:hypothetical protein
MVVAPTLLVIFRSLLVNCRSCISFVISKSASFTRFVKSTTTEDPSSIAMVNSFVAAFSVAEVRF